MQGRGGAEPQRHGTALGAPPPSPSAPVAAWLSLGTPPRAPGHKLEGADRRPVFLSTGGKASGKEPDWSGLGHRPSRNAVEKNGSLFGGQVASRATEESGTDNNPASGHARSLGCSCAQPWAQPGRGSLDSPWLWTSIPGKARCMKGGGKDLWEVLGREGPWLGAGTGYFFMESETRPAFVSHGTRRRRLWAGTGSPALGH